MRKFLSALNLVCVMFIFGCSKNGNDLKTYKLQFSKIGKSAWVISGYGQGSYHLEIDATDLKLSSDFDIQIGNGDFVQRPALQLFVDKDSAGYNQINNFYRSNGSYKFKPFKEFYFIDNLINFKVFLNKKVPQGLNTKMFHITSFSTEIPNKKN
ncbi:hypothetical protein [Spiroplasma endosymbiont of Clivina fossor]|uniref:hypothetical protein n=1 Tax=Spiroplasma endosymbiont of Clivina fossor TaxID=3066282 RepID=UPI00313B03B9